LVIPRIRRKVNIVEFNFEARIPQLGRNGVTP